MLSSLILKLKTITKMKKIIFLLTFLTLLTLQTLQTYSQVNRKTLYGKTTISDSVGSGSVNWYKLTGSNVYMSDSVWVGRWLWIGKTGGGIRLDTNGYGLISFDGYSLKIQNLKDNGSQNYWIGEGTASSFTWDKLSGSGDLELAQLDSTGFDLKSGSFKLNGTAIYPASNHLLTTTGGDTAKLEVSPDGLLINTNGYGVITFGDEDGNGTESIYAGAYYTGSTLGYLSSAWGNLTGSSTLYLSSDEGMYNGVAVQFQELTINGVTVKVLVQDDSDD